MTRDSGVTLIFKRNGINYVLNNANQSPETNSLDFRSFYAVLATNPVVAKCFKLISLVLFFLSVTLVAYFANFISLHL